MIYKIGFLGTGMMSSAHANNLSKLDNVKIVAACNKNLEKAVEFAEKYDAKPFSDFNQMIDDVDLDAVFVCIPPYAHNGEVEKAAEKGIHIFLEKPIALTVERGNSMVAAVKKYGVKTHVGYHCRFGGAVKELKKRIDSGEAGRPVLFNGRYECNSLHGPWWRDKTKCGSQVLEQAIHTYDMSMYLFGKPKTVSGYMANLCHENTEGYTVEDVGISNILFENGALGSITSTNCAVPGRWENPYTVVFENLTIFFQDSNHAIFVNNTTDKIENGVVNFENDMLLDEVKAFVNLLENKSESPCTIEMGLLGLKLALGVVNSSENNGLPQNIK